MSETVEDYLTRYYKVVNANLVQRGYQYKVGLNVDSNVFDYTCRAGGGLHFTTGAFVHKMLSFGDHFVEVTIPEKETVIKVNEEIYKAHRISISEPKPIKDFPLWKNTEYCIKVMKFGCSRYFKCPITAELILKAAELGEYNYVKNNITDAVARDVVQKNSDMVKYVKQNLELCRLAFEKDMSCFKHLEFTDEKMRDEAINYIPKYIDYISETDISDEKAFQLSKKYAPAIKKVKILTSDMWDFIMSNANMYFKHLKPNKELIKKAIILSPKCYSDVPYISDEYAKEFAELAVSLHGNNIREVPLAYRTASLYKLAIKQNPKVIFHIEYNIMPELYELALRADPKIYRDLPQKVKADVKIQKIVLETDGMMLYAVLNPTNESYEIAFGQNPNSIKFIRKDKHTIQQIIKALETDSRNIEYVDQRIELCMMSVMKEGRNLYYINLKNLQKRYPNNYKMIFTAAMKQNPDAIMYVPKDLQTAEMQELAVEYDGKNIKWCANQENEDLCIKAVESNPMALEFIKNQSDTVIKTALSKMGLAYKYVKNKSDEYRQIAIKQNPILAKYF